MPLERLSIELTNYCAKGCSFCYNYSSKQGKTSWRVDQLDAFIRDCAQHGTRAVSFGGGEPMEFEGLDGLLRGLQGVVFRSMTTHGLLLKDPRRFERLVEAAPDKVHISIHNPALEGEVSRVIEQVQQLQAANITAGVNLLVSNQQLDAVATATKRLLDAQLSAAQIVFLPLRGQDTPSPQQLIAAAGFYPLQSMSCLLGCASSPRFCSISHDKYVSWCSYTSSRKPLPSLDAHGLREALKGLGLIFCGEQGRPLNAEPAQ